MRYINEYIDWPDCETCGGSVEELEITEGDVPETWDVRLSLGCYDGVSYQGIRSEDLNDHLEMMAGHHFKDQRVVNAITDARTKVTLGQWSEDEE